MKPKIVWIIDSLGHGGAEKMTLAILKEMDRSKFDIRVCALQIKQGNPIAVQLQRIGISVDLLPISRLHHISNLPSIIGYIKKHKPDIIHTQLEFSNILGSIGAWLLKIPNISTIHSVDIPRGGTDGFRNELSWACMRIFSTRLIAVSETTRTHQIRYGRIPPEKIITIYNGIDPAVFQINNPVARRDIRKEFNIPDDTFLFLTVAVLREAKGVQHMVEAMTGITKNLPNAHYLIVGDGNYRPFLIEKIKSLGLEKKITLTGQRDDVKNLLHMSDLFVLPTLLDAFPTVLIEAMASGKAIIASRVGGVPELVSEGINGYLANPGDPNDLEKLCIKLAQDQIKRQSMEIAGSNIARKKFNISNQVEKLSNLYLELSNHEY